jgi:D-alanyl-D-alanine carboxypeptidase
MRREYYKQSQQELRALERLEYRRPPRHQGQNRSNHEKNHLVKTALVTLLLVGVFLGCAGASFSSLIDRLSSVGQAIAGTIGETSPVQEHIFDTPVSVDEISDTGFVRLINSEHSIDEERDGVSLTSVASLVPDNAHGEMLHPVALDALRGLFDKAHKERIDFLFAASGYRDYASQQQIYDETMDKSFVQQPGHSEHQSGLAIDIGVHNVTQSEMSTSREGRYLADNAWRDGLILRYPADKQEITGIAHEPWHFRYIGQPHAGYCKQNNLCLEQYIQLLKDTGGYTMKLGGKTYFVSYQTPNDGMLYVPGILDYNISSDNVDGYLITAWE